MTLGPYAIAMSSPLYGTRQFPVDTSFEPYRREAFRHKSIPPQRQSIMMTNIVGEGTVNTEGLWRREQVEWSMGAGQFSLDRKGDAQETRFLSSKGVDVFSKPLQATLLPDTYRLDSGTVGSDLIMTRCNGYVITATGGLVKAWASGWGSSITATGLSGTITSITSNETYIFVATTNGIYYGTVASGALTFSLYAGPDASVSGGYTLVRWANDQLIAANGNRLYAFQPRSASNAPYFGYGPSIGTGAAINNLTCGPTTSGTSVLVTTVQPHNFVAGQTINIGSSSIQIPLQGQTFTTNSKQATITTAVTGSLINVGDVITVTINYWDGTYTTTTAVTETVKVASIGTFGSYQTITYATTLDSTTVSNMRSYFASGSTTGTDNNSYNGFYTVNSVVSSNSFTITATPSASTVGVVLSTGGTASNSLPTDLLYVHNNPNWVWSDAVGGETQVYFAGYVSGTTKYGGCIYRADIPAASTSSATLLGSTSTSAVVQPFDLNTPVQALPMSPDEYPTCIQSYLNYIFIGTNRGIRMAQTLSQYDPSATMTGDLKSGPIIPNILQPVSNPVTAIIGDGRFVWFAWSNYDSTSTGLGKLDLTTYIAGDPLAPAYASDLMVTGQGIINSLSWDPSTNTPIMAVAGLGVYGPKATNVGGNLIATKYVASGSITSGTFDYGIADKKVPVYFDYGAVATHGSSVQATVYLDPNDPTVTTSQSVTAFTSGSPTEYALSTSNRAEQFQATVTLNAGTTVSSNDTTPTLHRWTLKSWPTVVQGTNISIVLQLFSVDVVDGGEVFIDPYEAFNWLENVRTSQDIITYTEGPLSVTAIIETLDWIPHKRRDNYENGFEGDCVVTLKTIGAYNYTTPATS